MRHITNVSHEYINEYINIYKNLLNILAQYKLVPENISEVKLGNYIFNTEVFIKIIKNDIKIIYFIPIASDNSNKIRITFNSINYNNLEILIYATTSNETISIVIEDIITSNLNSERIILEKIIEKKINLCKLLQNTLEKNNLYIEDIVSIVGYSNEEDTIVFDKQDFLNSIDRDITIKNISSFWVDNGIIIKFMDKYIQILIDSDKCIDIDCYEIKHIKSASEILFRGLKL